MEKFNFISCYDGERQKFFRISNIMSFNIVNDTFDYVNNFPMYTANAKKAKLAKWAGKICDLELYFSDNEKSRTTIESITKGTANIIRMIICNDGEASDDLIDAMENDGYFEYGSGEVTIKSVLDEE